MPDKNACDALKDTPAYKWCTGEEGRGSPPEGPPGVGGSITDGAVTNVRDIADSLIKKIQGLVAPDSTWAPETADSWVYEQFLWLGQHLAIAIFVCVVVVCGLTAWQGAPRLKQLGASTGWTLAAVAGMAAVPGIVTLLNKAVSGALKALVNSDEGTLFAAISADMDDAADAANPLSVLLILSALVVALAFAALVFMTRSLGILAFVCIAPLVIASLARGGDTSAVKAWTQRLLGLMLAPFALLLVAPFVQLVKGALVMDAVLLVAADALMLRMIFHGVPYFGPRAASAARAFVERRTENPLARAVVRAGAPDVYEQENTPRGPRTVDTPGRAASQDRGVLFAAYGIKKQERPGRLTTASATDRASRDAARSAQIIKARSEARSEARRQAREAARPASTKPTPGPQPTPTQPNNT